MANKVAVAVHAFKRPDYLKQTLDSLIKARGNFDCDFYGYQDGAVNDITGNRYAEESEIAESLGLLMRRPNPFRAVEFNASNIGIARTKAESNKLFDSYEKVFFFEDDMVVSEYYFNVLNQALTEYPLHMIYLFAHPSTGESNHLVHSARARLWGYGMTAELFNKMKADWEFYASVIEDMDYKKRGEVAPEKRRLLKDKIGIDSVLHDVLITNLARKHGNGKLRSTVSRGFYIGKESSINKGSVWYKRELDEQTPLQHLEGDKDLKGLVIV